MTSIYLTKRAVRLRQQLKEATGLNYSRIVEAGLEALTLRLDLPLPKPEDYLGGKNEP